MSTAAERSARPIGGRLDNDDPGWSRRRIVKPEDIEATIYSAMGINWTTVRYDDPFGRGFEYVPSSEGYDFEPINELWTAPAAPATSS